MTPHALVPAILGAVILFGLYRRFRRTFGRQPVQRKRMTARIVLLMVVAVVMLFAGRHNPQLLAGGAAGAVAGVALAVLGLRLTRFERSAEGEFYTPNTYIGAALTALLVGRLLYRFVVLAPVMQAAAAQSSGDSSPLAAVNSSPLTLGILMVLVGYYVTYFAGVLRKASSASP